MNPLLAKLHPYPFERLRQLFAGTVPNPAYAPISLRCLIEHLNQSRRSDNLS